MKLSCNGLSQIAGCLAVFSVGLALLAAPSRARADEMECLTICLGMPDGLQCYNDCMAYGIVANCPNAENNPCSLNNGNQMACGVLGCRASGPPAKLCWCAYSAPNCNCP